MYGFKEARIDLTNLQFHFPTRQKLSLNTKKIVSSILTIDILHSCCGSTVVYSKVIGIIFSQCVINKKLTHSIFWFLFLTFLFFSSLALWNVLLFVFRNCISVVCWFSGCMLKPVQMADKRKLQQKNANSGAKKQRYVKVEKFNPKCV